MWEQQNDGVSFDLRGRRTSSGADGGDGLPEPGIPNHEMNSLLLVVGDAFTAGDSGEAARGYLLLRLGFERALRMNSEGNPWVAQLCAHWKRFLAEYELRHPEVRPAQTASH